MKVRALEELALKHRDPWRIYQRLEWATGVANCDVLRLGNAKQSEAKPFGCEGDLDTVADIGRSARAAAEKNCISAGADAVRNGLRPSGPKITSVLFSLAYLGVKAVWVQSLTI